MTAAFLIIGAGEAGMRAALRLREEGWSGEITVFDADSDAPYERPPLSKSALELFDSPSPTYIAEAASLDDAGIRLEVRTKVSWIDRNAHEIELANGRRMPYERLLLATGSTARRLPPQFDHDGVLYLRSFADAVAIHRALGPGKRVVTIGGGFIGLEVAAAAAVRSCAVTVIERADRVLSRIVPPPIAAEVVARHAASGVSILTDVGVDRIDKRDDDLRITLNTGRTIDCDAVVAAVGAVPATALAHQAGLAIDNGVSVDPCLATSDPDVFAAGDCCSFPHGLFHNRRIRFEAWTMAQDQGDIAAKNMLGAGIAYEGVPWFWSDQFELTLQMSGLPDAGSTEIVRTRSDGVDLHFILDDSRLVAASGIGIGGAVARDIRIAEKMIGRRATPDPAHLADPSVSMKQLLRTSPVREKELRP